MDCEALTVAAEIGGGERAATTVIGETQGDGGVAVNKQIKKVID